MIEEFQDFLKSFKNSEGLSDELREHLSTAETMRDVARQAIEEGRTVLVTGSAGSGKTHLIDNVVSALGTTSVVGVRERPRHEHVLVVRDATELNAAERISAVSSASTYRLGTLIGINEGPLREAAQHEHGDIYAAATDLLHKAQRGLESPYEPDTPTIIDLGSFDPLEAGVIDEILSLPILQEAFTLCNCEYANSDCPRINAATQLKSAAVRKRISNVLRLAKLSEPEWLYRDIWDFVADLVFGGDCSEDPPSSPWFFRMFYGDSRMARAILSVADPLMLPLPMVDSRLFFGDWTAPELKLIDGVEIVPVSQPWSAVGRFEFLKAQALLLNRDVDLASRILNSTQGDVMAQVLLRNPGPVIRLINEYVAFGLAPASQTKLDLVTEHRVERAQHRKHHLMGLIRLGDAPLDEFAIRSSNVLINYSKSRPVPGARYYLVHLKSSSSLELTRERLQLMQRGRSLRLSDRAQVDLDWHLFRFFDDILRTNTSPNELGVHTLSFDTLSVVTTTYRADAGVPVLERVQ